MTDLLQCPECKEWFNPAFIDQVALHMHDGVVLDETFKGIKTNFMDIEEIKSLKERLRSDIENLLDKFEEQTGLLVTDIQHAAHREQIAGMSKPIVLSRSLNIKVEI